MTVEQHFSEARRVLEAVGIPSGEARLDAELLARHVLGWDRAVFVARRREEAPDGFEEQYAPLIERRVRREPVAYIRGVQEFYGREFEVTPGVLIPRPETEGVVEEALAFVSGMPGADVIDVGTGSGCLAITIALEANLSPIWATDTSAQALAVAHSNGEVLGLGDGLRLRRGEYFAGITGPFDLIVSNPPYVEAGDRHTLAPEVLHEPPQALFAGEDGLDVIRELIARLPRHLAPGGICAIEIGHRHADAVAALVSQTPTLQLLRVREDLQRIPRVAVIGTSYTP